ncbi:MAG: hypothetical protein ACPF9D_11855, partial [Owenweeksia sp.]
WMSALIWRVEKVKSWLTGKKAVVTRETAHTAQRTYYYDSEKVRRVLGFKFRPVRETVEDMARHYRKWRQQ